MKCSCCGTTLTSQNTYSFEKGHRLCKKCDKIFCAFHQIKIRHKTKKSLKKQVKYLNLLVSRYNALLAGMSISDGVRAERKTTR